MTDIPTLCPRCAPSGLSDVEVTTMGGPLTGGVFDDMNKAKCCVCGHQGKAGDWQRLVAARAESAKLRALLEEVDAIDAVRDLELGADLSNAIGEALEEKP